MVAGWWLDGGWMVAAHFIHDISAQTCVLLASQVRPGTGGWEVELNKYHLYCSQPGPLDQWPGGPWTTYQQLPTALILGNLSCINSFEKQKVGECTEYLLNTSYNIVCMDNWTI